MKTLVINRTKDTVRYQFQSEQLKRLGMDFERITATEVDTLTDRQKEDYQDNWQRPLRQTEIACTLSHHQCWQKIADTGETHFIIEDDAYMSNHTKAILDQLSDDKEFDIISLETRDRDKFISKSQFTLQSCIDHQLSCSCHLKPTNE